MVEQPAKPAPKNISTWWHRGPSGLVEEWETRVSEEEITRRQDRWRSTPAINAKSRKTKTSTPRSWPSLFQLPEFSSYDSCFPPRLCEASHSSSNSLQRITKMRLLTWRLAHQIRNSHRFLKPPPSLIRPTIIEEPPVMTYQAPPPDQPGLHIDGESPDTQYP